MHGKENLRWGVQDKMKQKMVKRTFGLVRERGKRVYKKEGRKNLLQNHVLRYFFYKNDLKNALIFARNIVQYIMTVKCSCYGLIDNHFLGKK